MRNSPDQMNFFHMMYKLNTMTFRASPGGFLLHWTILIVAGIALGAIAPFTQMFFDSVNSAANKNGSIGTAIMFAVIVGLLSAMKYVFNGISQFVSEFVLEFRIKGYLSQEINAKASRVAPITYETPEYLDDINKANQGMENAVSVLSAFQQYFVYYLPYFVFTGFYFSSLNPALTIAVVAIFIPIIACHFLRGTMFSRLEDKAAPLRREFEYYEKCIKDREYFKETRLLGGFLYFNKLYTDALELLNKETWRVESKTQIFMLYMKIITLIGYLAVLYLLFTSLMSGQISVGAFAAVYGAVNTVLNTMEDIAIYQLDYITRNIGTVRNFLRFLDLPECTGKEVKINALEGISIKNASFRYPNAKNESLSNVSLDIAGGETIAIVGENGAGKTTLTKLICGLYTPSSGSVHIGGEDTRDIAPASLYRSISGVFQKYQRYKMTLGDNIDIGDMDTIDEDSRNISAEKADIDVSGFSDGYATMLAREFDGIDLSGGQWQRVAMARGFFRAHDMIILDEPTAAIDPIEETKIYMKFKEISQGKTAIIVTHRLGSAKIAARIVVMDGGRIVEIGNHDELIALGGVYAKMYTAQAQWYQ